MNISKNLVLWVVIAVLLAALFNLFQNSSTTRANAAYAYSDFLAEVESGRVADVTMQGDTINGHFTDGRSFSTYSPQDVGIVQTLRKNNVRISALPKSEESQTFWSYVLSWLPMLLVVGVWIFFMRQMQSTGGKAMGFGKSRARLLTEKTGRRRHRRGQAGTRGNRRVPQGSAEIPAPGRQDPQGLSAGRSSRHWQDLAGTRHCR